MGRLPILLIAGLLFFAQPFLRAQDEGAVRSIIREVDQKKLVKADTYKAQADQLTEEASRLNMEVFTVQSDPTPGEKAIAKKTKQLEEQALKKQTEASSLYEKGNEIRFAVYKQYIDEFWESHENQESDFLNAKLLEEQASDNYFQAVSYRLEARKMEDILRVQKLTEANELENQAIGKQLTALSQYHGISPEITPETNQQPAELPETVPDVPSLSSSDQVIEDTFKQESTKITSFSPSDSVLPKDMMIDQSMIDSYNRYIAEGQLNDTALSTGAIAGVTSFEHDRLLELWYDYIYGAGEIATPAADSLPGDQEVAVIDKTGQATAEKEIGIVTDENIGKMVPADEEVIYRVQIAANRNELSQRALSRMYYGNNNVEMINENGWYKYSVGDFDSYEEASTFRKASGINNAFVVAYRKGTRFSGSVAPDSIGAPLVKNSPLISVPEGAGKLPDGLIFRIQVAASRVPFTVGQLKNIYSGSYPVEMIAEDGWYKYQLMGVRLFSDAAAMIREIKSPGAFIVAYTDGKKSDLARAVRDNRELESRVKARGAKGVISETEYHVQLAASHIALSRQDVSILWPRPEEVSVIYEEGWYKYHLKAGNSAENAEALRISCNIKGAFITSYKKAAKINYYQARQEK